VAAREKKTLCPVVLKVCLTFYALWLFLNKIHFSSFVFRFGFQFFIVLAILIHTYF
jgi:hypothetical protein